jgi:IS30 family transposase
MLACRAIPRGSENKEDMKNMHLTDADRLEIEHGLRHGLSASKIAAKIGKNRSTVKREIRARSTPSDKGAYGRVTNRCVLRMGCKKLQLCMDKPDCVKRCSFCRLCNEVCPDFSEEVCPKLSSPPYVCNGCPDETRCVLRKRYYLHAQAHRDYRGTLVASREGANITEGELFSLNETLSPLVMAGQSVHHALVNNPDLFFVNEKSVYRYIAGGLLSAKNGDMPRVCSLKPRKRKPVEHKVDTKCRLGRTHAEFLAFTAENPGFRVVELDSVIGRVGGKVLLTMLFRDCGLMLAFLRERNDSQSVIDAFALLWREAGPELFRRLFQVLLTDNGSEFSNPLALENAPDGSPRSRLFYCDPCASWQKGRVERNHEFLRLVMPKGTSFDALAQADIDKALSHVNSYSRPSLNDKSPFDLFAFTYGNDLLDRLGISRIPANHIVLKPSLLGR